MRSIVSSGLNTLRLFRSPVNTVIFTSGWHGIWPVCSQLLRNVVVGLMIVVPTIKPLQLLQRKLARM
nr:MAG TPA: hypothetical protein [Caudoviricetes sp.]